MFLTGTTHKFIVVPETWGGKIDQVGQRHNLDKRTKDHECPSSCRQNILHVSHEDVRIIRRPHRNILGRRNTEDDLDQVRSSLSLQHLFLCLGPSICAEEVLWVDDVMMGNVA